MTSNDAPPDKALSFPGPYGPDSAPKRKAVTFYMEHFTERNLINSTYAATSDDKVHALGPLGDYGAPYSAIGHYELKPLAPSISPNWLEELNTITSVLI